MTEPQPIERLCKACGLPFTITVDEQAWWRALAEREGASVVTLPWRCTPCRVARRRENERVDADGQDEQLECADCRAPFTFTAGEKAYYADRRYAKPRRCEGCRARRRGAATVQSAARHHGDHP